MFINEKRNTKTMRMQIKTNNLYAKKTCLMRQAAAI